MDYAMPRADEVPFCDIALHPVPTPTNPLGVKGAGEAGTVGGMPCVLSAVRDALASAGAGAIEMPLTPEKVWASARGCDGSGWGRDGGGSMSRGQDIHPEMALLVEGKKAMNAALTPEETARAFARYAEMTQRPHPSDMQVEDRFFPGPEGNRVPVRHYRPRHAASPAPCILYFHGGGFVLGDLDSSDTVAWGHRGVGAGASHQRRLPSRTAPSLSPPRPKTPTRCCATSPAMPRRSVSTRSASAPGATAPAATSPP